MLRRRIPEARAILRQLFGRISPEGSTNAASSPPVRHFVERLIGGGAAPTCRVPSALSDAPSTKVRAGGGDPASLTVHFLRHSCGLAEADAARAAERVRLRCTRNAHAVLALLRDTLGMPTASVARLVAAYPAVLSSVTIGDRLDFYLHELGLAPAEVRRFIFASPYRLLAAGIDSRLRPNYRLLRDLLGSDKNVLTAVKQSIELIYDNLEVVLLPKVQALRDYGVTEEVLVKLVTTHPKALVHRSTRFDEGLAAMKEFGVSPTSGIFPYAFGLFAKIYQSKWDRRVENYLSLGWTKEQIIRAFVKHPYCMSVSDDKVRQLMGFFSEKLGWGPEHVSSAPTILSFGYEKRLLPRYKVLEILVSRDVLKKGIKMSHLTLSEKKFVDRYVNRYQQVIPEVREAYGARTGRAVK
jgi:mTERF domain-containing protein